MEQLNIMIKMVDFRIDKYNKKVDELKEIIKGISTDFESNEYILQRINGVKGEIFFLKDLKESLMEMRRIINEELSRT